MKDFINFPTFSVHYLSLTSSFEEIFPSFNKGVYTSIVSSFLFCVSKIIPCIFCFTSSITSSYKINDIVLKPNTN